MVCHPTFKTEKGKWVFPKDVIEKDGLYFLDNKEGILKGDSQAMSKSKKNIFITWEEPTLSHEDFFDRILDFEAVLCPQGNGFGDNHRIYETLYLNRIPITTGPHVHKSLHHKFPVILIEDISLLKNYNFMREQIDIAKSKIWDKNLLDLDYWESKILSLI